MQISRPVMRQLVSRNTWRLSTSVPAPKRIQLAYGLGIARQLHYSSPIRPQPPTLFFSKHNTQPHFFQHRFTSSQSTAPSSFADPSRPDLFYHVVNGPTPISKTLPAFAVSFSSEQPPTSSSVSIIGWLPTQENAPGTTNEGGPGGDATLADFIMNCKHLLRLL